MVKKIATSLMFTILFFVVACSSGGNSGGSGASSFICNESLPTYRANSSLGTNLPLLGSSNSSQWFFVDAMAKSSPWYAATDTGFTNGTISSYSASGWPDGVATGTSPAVVLFSQIEGQYPAGTYNVYWEGSGGYVEGDGDANNNLCSDNGAISTCTTGASTFTVSQPSNDGLVIFVRPFNSTYNNSNHVRNIRVIMPGGVCGRSSTDLDYTQYCQSQTGGVGSCDSGETCFDFNDVHWNKFVDPVTEMSNPKVVFHPQSVGHYQGYRNVRFMPPQYITGSTVSNWSERTTLVQHSGVKHGTSSDSGIAPEYIAAFANLLDANVWLNVPHLSDDNYNTQFAALMASQLESELDIWVEYSNEHWNTDTEYTQSTYMLNQANATLALLGLSSGDTDAIKRGRYYAYRSKQIHDLWRAQFPGAESRIVRVYGTSTGDPSVTTSIYQAPNVSASDVDAIAIAAYMGVYASLPSNESVIENLTATQLMDDLYNGTLGIEDNTSGQVSEIQSYISSHLSAAQAQDPSARVVAYEGGLHLSGLGVVESNTAIQSLFEETSRASQMYELHQDLLNMWRNSGADLFMNFNVLEEWGEGHGTFGNMQYELDNPSNYPRECAFRQFLNNVSCWWSGCIR